MLDFTLTELFGAGAVQDANTLTIQKASLPGLTPSANNRAEQLLVALLLHICQQIRGQITDEIGQPITAETGQALTFENQYLRADVKVFKQSIVRTPSNRFLRTVLVVQFWVKPITLPPQALTPDGVNYAN